MYAKNNYDSPLIGKIVRNSNSLKINSRRNYSTLKNKMENGNQLRGRCVATHHQQDKNKIEFLWILFHGKRWKKVASNR